VTAMATSDTTRQIADAVAALLRSHSDGPGRFDNVAALIREASAGGWFDVVTLGLSSDPDIEVSDALLACEILGRHAAPMSLVAAVGFVHPLLAALGPAPVGRQLASWLAEGRIVAVPATLLAPGASGEDAGFTLSGNVQGRIVDGTLRLFGAVDVTDAAADVVLVGFDQARLAAVPVNRAGMTVHSLPSIVPGLHVARVSFDGVEVDDALVQVEDVAAAVRVAAATWSLVLDGFAVGICREMVRRTVEFVCAREQFGRAVGEFQSVQHVAADMHVAAETSFGIASVAAQHWAEDPRTGLPEVLASRLYCAASAVAVCESAIQLHGGMGFTWEMGLHYWYRIAQFARGYLIDDYGIRSHLAAHVQKLATAKASTS
jgi:alkylation response protein AidB-like acyl-CoA dehydrogenase